MHTELHSAEDLVTHALRHGHLRGIVVHGHDLRAVEDLLTSLSTEGAVFVGCELGDAARDQILQSGGLVFPRMPGLPFHAYKPELYTPDELMHGYTWGQPETFADTLDGRIWAWYRANRELRGARLPVLEAMAQRLHDHAMDDAMGQFIEDGPGDGEPHRLVAVMGGHALARTSPAYREVALLGRQLAREGYLVTTGGGPGAMEAAHLGAWLAHEPAAAVDQALALLVGAPGYEDPGWFESADAVRQRWPSGASVHSLAIPTWFYGHEPTNLFASHVAKYFSNSLREDGLLAVASHGVVYAPGSAGTVQEVFMDAAQNHYGTFFLVSPMVFLDRDYWQRERPVAPLLERLAQGRQYASMIGLVDHADAALAFLRAHPPVPYQR